MIKRHGRIWTTALIVCLVWAPSGRAENSSGDPLRVCNRAAVRAEVDWHLPAGLLSAIGTVESGGGLGTTADTDPDQAIETRRRMFQRLAGTPVLIIGTHFAGVTAGRLVTDGDVYRLDV
jgi:hypothetical protein